MKKATCFAGLVIACLLFSVSCACAQTSWKGTLSTAWNLSGNWTNGVPTATTDATIGDASFTGAYQPSISAAAYCRALQIGGTKTSTLTVIKNFTVTGNLSISSNGTLSHSRATITVQGNWTNDGTYTAINNNTVISFGGISQILGGSSATVFRRLKINAGSTVTLAANISSAGSSNYINVYGTLNPGQTTQFTVTASSSFTVFSAGVLKVNASTLAQNYAPSLTLSAGSIVDYSSSALNQTVSALTYSTLKISGATVKSLAANLPALLSTSAAYGNIYVTSGTFDLGSYTANRGTTVAGGNFSVSNGATLKIGGTNSFPANYTTNTLSLTSITEYNGTTQTVASRTYGNLRLNSASGTATKTTAATDFTVAGNLVTSTGAGTGVIFNAGANITVSGIDSIGASTTFNGGAYSHIIAGNWVNNGTFTGNTSTINMTGAGTSISGGGTQNFHNLSISASNVIATSAAITVSGNLATTGSGTFTHSSGILTLAGTGTSVSGAGILFNSLSITGTVVTASTFSITANLSVPGSLTASAGNILLTGASNSLSGAGSLSFYGLLISGAITTTADFSVSNALDVSGSFTASTGTATFAGATTLNGTVNLYNVALNGTSLLLSTNSILGISNNFTITAGTLNVTTAIPNTVCFNGAGAQNIPAATFDRLTLATGGTKTASGSIGTNGVFTINAGVTFNAASFTHALQNNFVNNGSFVAATSVMSFTGSKDATISGATTFNELRVNKTSAANVVTLMSDMNTPLVNMNNGVLKSGSHTLTITNTRTGNGIILGNIRRLHAFTTGIAYAFESPDNTILFSSVSGVNSITVNVSATNIPDFPYGAAVNRLYDITVPAGTYAATLRLHYNDAELNGNSESSMLLWNYNGSSWVNIGKTANSTSANYVEQSGLTSMTNRWSFSGLPTVLRWNGSVSTDWNTAANWTAIQGAPGPIPGTNDVVQIGQGGITHQPLITTAVSVKNIEFGSTAAAILTLGTGGSLTTSGNINGSWTSAATHVINVGTQNLAVSGSLVLSDGTNGHSIDLNASTGTVTIGESLTQSGGANITLSGAAALHIGESFNYTSGLFSGGTSTVYYEGSQFQAVGGVNYHNLTILKSNGIASIDYPLAVGGAMSVTGGELNLNANTTLAGNLVVNPGSTITFNDVTMSIGGDLNNSGNFIPGSGTISFTGTGDQLISLATFNNIIINKPSGATNFTGSINVYGNFSILSGNIDIGTYTANRTSLGGVFTIAAGASLTVAGTSNFPSSYSSNLLNASSTVTYNGTGVQTVNGVVYGNLVLSNGGANAKSLAGHTTVNGNITLNSGATLSGESYNLSLAGNWVNNGTFVPSTGAVLLLGTAKTITGATTFNKLTVYGSYAVAGSDIVYNGLVNVIAGGSYNGGSGVGTVHGDLINSGTLISTGTTTFSGTVTQTIRLLSPILSTANGVINFNGTVAPVLNSTATPQFATVNINNTGGVNPSVNWILGIGFNVSAGAVFNGGVSTHYFYGSFVNNGTVTSSGTLSFLPSTPKTYTISGTAFSSTGTVNFGGSAAITVTGTPTSLNDVVISNTTGVTPGSNWTISRNFTISSTGVFNAGSYNYAVGGDIESNGTLNGGTSTFTMNGTTVEIAGSPNTSFYNFVVEGSVSASVNFNVLNNFTNNNVFDASVGNLVMTGSGPGIISGTASPFTLAQVDIAKTGTGTVTLAKSLVDVMNMDIVSGTLNTSTYSITQDVNGGALYIRNYATIQIGGTNTLPSFSSYGLDTLSTVEYNGTTQVIASLSAAGGNYGNLLLSTAGIKSANGSLNIFHDFTLLNGSFTMGSYVDTLCGNWSMASGTLNSSGSTLTLLGTRAQTINSTGGFNTLVVNKYAGSTTLGSSITLAGTLVFTAGVITTGSNVLALTSVAGTVTGAGQLTGWVNGRMQKVMPLGATSRTFEIGDSSSYTPATVAFSSVGTAGNLTAGVTRNDHTDIANSGINGGRSVNRFYTFTNSGVVFTTATINFNWVAVDVDAGSITSSFKVKSYNGSTWSLLTVTSPLATSIQANNVSSFGDFAVGETISSTTWTGASSTNWNTAGNWSAGVPTASTNIVIPGGLTNYPLVSSGTVYALNSTINTGGVINISGGTLALGGIITNSGNIDATNGSLQLNGNFSQDIPAGLFVNNTIRDLTIGNAAGVTLSGSLGLTGVLTVSAGGFSTGGYLTLRSSASGTARVAPVTGGSITGNVTVERYTTNRRAWRLLTLPVAHSNNIYSSWQNGGVYETGKGTFVSGTSPDPLLNGLDYNSTNISSMKTFSTSTQAFEEITNTHITTLSTNTKDHSDNIGYFIFVRGDRNPANLFVTSSSSTTLSGTGKLQTGPQYFPASSTANKYTLVGNPYASPIDFSLLAKTNLVNRFFVWDPTLNQVGGYVTVDDLATPGVFTASPTSTQTKEIQSGQAFFIVTQANGPASIAMDESSKSSTNNTAMFRPVPGTTAVASFRTDLFLANAGSTSLADGTLVQFKDDFNAGVDYQDADKFGNVNETIGLLRKGKLLSIERKPMAASGDTLFLKLTKVTPRNYQFVFTAENLGQHGLTAFLEDSYTKLPTPLDLNGSTKVNFSVNSSTASMVNDRFRIVFKPAAVLPVTFTSVSARENNHKIVVEWKVVQQLNIKSYEVERSADGRTFNKMHSTAPVAGDNASYTWLDEKPLPGANFFRVRNLDQDGSLHYSPVVKVEMATRGEGYSVYPNPVRNSTIGFQFKNKPGGEYRLRLLNLAGQVVFTKSLVHGGGNNRQSVAIGKHLDSGLYKLEITNAANEATVISVHVK